MSDNDLSDMDYFLHEDDDLDDDFSKEGYFLLGGGIDNDESHSKYIAFKKKSNPN